jgi:nucleotide-binding universal stress UspA family protein
MKLLFATAGRVSAQENADYVVNIAKRLKAHLTVLHVVNERSEEENGIKTLEILFKSGKMAKVPVTGVLEQGDVVSQIIAIAEKESAALIVMGASREMPLEDWLSSYAKQKTRVPVLVIPDGKASPKQPWGGHAK